MGEVVKEQLDKSLTILGRLEGRLDKGSSCFPQLYDKLLITFEDQNLTDALNMNVFANEWILLSLTATDYCICVLQGRLLWMRMLQLCSCHASMH